MTGADLYLMYENAHAEQDVAIDLWDELDESEQEIWNVMAARITHDNLHGKAEE